MSCMLESYPSFPGGPEGCASPWLWERKSCLLRAVDRCLIWGSTLAAKARILAMLNHLIYVGGCSRFDNSPNTRGTRVSRFLHISSL